MLLSAAGPDALGAVQGSSGPAAAATPAWEANPGRVQLAGAILRHGNGSCQYILAGGSDRRALHEATQSCCLLHSMQGLTRSSNTMSAEKGAVVQDIRFVGRTVRVQLPGQLPRQECCTCGRATWCWVAGRDCLPATPQLRPASGAAGPAAPRCSASVAWPRPVHQGPAAQPAAGPSQV